MSITTVPQDILQRIKKLLTLGQNAGATDAEAALAMQKARALLDEYNLTMGDVPDPTAKADAVASLQRESVSASVGTRPWIKKSAPMIGQAIGKLYDCMFLINMRTGYSFVGAVLDVEVAQAAYAMVQEQLKARRRVFLHEHGYQDRNERWILNTDFMVGAAFGVVKRVEEVIAARKAAMAAATTAITIRKQDVIEQWSRQHGVRMGRASSPHRLRSSEAYQDGYRTGEKVRLVREVAGAAA